MEGHLETPLQVLTHSHPTICHSLRSLIHLLILSSLLLRIFHSLPHIRHRFDDHETEGVEEGEEEEAEEGEEENEEEEEAEEEEEQ